MSHCNNISSQDAARDVMIHLYGGFRSANRTVLSYSLKDEKSPLECYDIDMMIKAALNDTGFHHLPMYSHLLRHAWFSVGTVNSNLFKDLFLEEAREYRCLSGLEVEIDGNAFVV